MRTNPHPLKQKTNPKQCFTKKIEFGFAQYGGPGGIRTLDLSDANRTLSHADLKEAPKDKTFLLKNGKKHRRNAGFRTSIAFEKKLPFLLQCKKVTLQEKCASDAI